MTKSWILSALCLGVLLAMLQNQPILPAQAQNKPIPQPPIHQNNPAPSLSKGIPAPAASSTSGGVTQGHFDKLKQAILMLDKRSLSLEKETKKISKMENDIASIKNDISALRQDLARLRADEEGNRKAIVELHQRMTYKDGRNKSVQF